MPIAKATGMPITRKIMNKIKTNSIFSILLTSILFLYLIRKDLHHVHLNEINQLASFPNFSLILSIVVSTMSMLPIGTLIVTQV